MEHYSIRAIDIYISEIIPKSGCHRGDARAYYVKNCAWESQIELKLQSNQYGYYELHGKQIFKDGDKQKMMHDQSITFMAFQLHINQKSQERRDILWAERNT